MVPVKGRNKISRTKIDEIIITVRNSMTIFNYSSIVKTKLPLNDSNPKRISRTTPEYLGGIHEVYTTQTLQNHP